MSKIKIKYDEKYSFVSMMRTSDGFYYRTGVMKDGVDTGIDPFMTSFPELIDVGIMGSCEHGMSGLCLHAGVECYQNGYGKSEDHMSLENFKRIVDECKAGGTFQLALGGRGDVDQHPQFEEILRYAHDNGITPNFTTSGLGLTQEHVDICKKYCGAVAVSWYRSQYTINAIKMLVESGVTTNIHYVLGNNSIDEAGDRLMMQQYVFPKGINAVIFLLHKPVGLGSKKNVLQFSDPKVQRFFKMVDDHGDEFPFKVGFDSCCVPALVNIAKKILPNSMDTCEAGRWSCYITPDMHLLPCSFDNQKMRWAVDLSEMSIKEAWDSETFESFRDVFRRACPSCDKRLDCLGGCQIVPEIVLCDRRKEEHEWVKFA